MQSSAEGRTNTGTVGANRDVARVFFSYENGRLVEMRGLSLRNHLENVACLAENWDFKVAFGGGNDVEVPETSADRSRWLIEAARRHDLGKPGRFKIKTPQAGSGDRFTYSFSGHRFDVEDERPYVQQLIRLHHSFSVSDVTEAQALLKLRCNTPDVTAAAAYFPLDLYALEMCDQIEAESSTHVFDTPGERQRAFMEFEVYPDTQITTDIDGGVKRLRLFPYPFREQEVRLSFESFVVRVPAGTPLDGDTLKRLLIADGVVEWQSPRKVALCPLQ